MQLIIILDQIKIHRNFILIIYYINNDFLFYFICFIVVMVRFLFGIVVNLVFYLTEILLSLGIKPFQHLLTLIRYFLFIKDFSNLHLFF